MKAPVKMLASALYLGYTPLIPGTMGSLAGLFIAWFSNAHLWLEFTILSITGFLVCKPAVQSAGTQDPQHFVLDEVCGMMLSVLWLPLNALLYLSGFALFRALDSLKPWPISRIQRSDSAYAIMWDDLAAGLLTNLILHILNRLQLFNP